MIGAALPEGIEVTHLATATATATATDDRMVRLRAPLDVHSFGINQVILQPGQRNRIHSHTAQEEVYVVLAGTLTLVLEGEGHDFAPGAVVKVAPGVRRQLTNRQREPLSLLAVGGLAAHQHNVHDGEAFLSWDDPSPRLIGDVPLPDDCPPDPA
jgi:uncharacterized cupin superfamily protein